MHWVRQMNVFAFVLAAMLVAVNAAAAVPNNGNSQFAHDSHKKDQKDKSEKRDKEKGDFNTNRPGSSQTTPVSVPEPTTIALFGAAAGLVGVRKVWQMAAGRSGS